MSEENTAKQQASQEVPQEQLNLIREHFHKNVHAKYIELVNLIQTLPLRSNGFEAGPTFLNTGMLWVKEQIMYAPFIQPNAPTSLPPVTPIAKATETPIKEDLILDPA
jgi:hypothetical protein